MMRIAVYVGAVIAAMLTATDAAGDCGPLDQAHAKAYTLYFEMRESKNTELVEQRRKELHDAMRASILCNTRPVSTEMRASRFQREHEDKERATAPKQ